MAITNQSQQNNFWSDNSQFDSFMQSSGTDLHFDSHTPSNNFDHDAQNILQSLDGSHGLSDNTIDDHNNHDHHNNLNHSDGNDQPFLSDHSHPFDTDSHDQNHQSDNLDDHHNQLDNNIHQLSDSSSHDPSSIVDSGQDNDHNLDMSHLPNHLPNLTDDKHSHENLSSSLPGEVNAGLHETQQLQSLNYTESGAITTSDNKSVELYANSNIYWHSGARIGRVDGQNFYDSYGNYIGRLGADLNVYNADGCKIGCVTPSGNAYTPGGKLFATGGTARWAAATLIFNTCL